MYTTHSTFFSVVSQYLSGAFLSSFDTYQGGMSCPVEILVPLCQQLDKVIKVSGDPA